jgi:hypothetical protein
MRTFVSLARLRLAQVLIKLQFSSQFTSRSIGRRAQIVLEPAIQRSLFLLLPASKDFSPPYDADIRGCEVSDPFVVTVIVVQPRHQTPMSPWFPRQP